MKTKGAGAPSSSSWGALLESIRGTTWPAARRVHGSRAGTHPSRLKGRAPELSEYRFYRQGDDPRDLDWKLLARSDRAFVRLSDDRAIHVTWLLVDGSVSMAWPESTKAKWNAACGIAVGLASLASQAGDPVGVIVAASGAPHVLLPSARHDVVERIAHTLTAATPGPGEGLATILRSQSPRTRDVIVTDALGDEGPLLSAASSRRATGGEVILVHVVSGDEIDPPRDLVLARDPEDATIVRPLAADSRPGYVAAFTVWQDALRQRWTAAGARYARVIAEDDLAPSIRAIVRRLAEAD